ncbi:hypothetical protein EW146_g1196 [Bondarzewia mesenterica]|uniref:F-box domain-containing protein n=1 Tax=Bondarzewia mesenterica TaxID=1095465 RepID=A0A4S4M552_9AGAM|nr:hypothetical protein EW146_g1196 [Bondarzewia mesenterica]
MPRQPRSSIIYYAMGSQPDPVALATPSCDDGIDHTRSKFAPHATSTPHNPSAPLHPQPSSRRRPPVDIFTKSNTFSSVSLGKWSGSLAARGVYSYSMQLARSGSATAEQSIPHLREALSSLESKMASLMSERDRLESRLEQAVRLQSPVQRLPSELLASIFTIGVLEMEEEDPLMLSNLTLVCRYWSDVATKTPVLWSRIAIGNHDSLDKAQRRLSRSKSVPLDVCINFSPKMEHGDGTTEAVIHAMDLLRPSIWRWRSFHLVVPNRPQAHAALSRCREQAPKLEILQVRIFNSVQEDHYSLPPLPLFGGYVPSLRTCSFTSFNFGWDTTVVSGLRVLELGGYWNGFSPSVGVILDILRACPDLEDLALRNMSDVDPETCEAYDFESVSDKRQSSRVIQLPRLSRVSFYYAGINRTRAVFSQLSFPSLERVELCYMDNVTPVLKHLKRQSLTSLPLRQLRIETSLFSELEFAKLLGRMSSLITLELIDVEDASSSLLKGLSSPSIASTWVCPKLETLSLEGCTSLDWDSLRMFVESRLPEHSRAYPRQGATPILSLPAPRTYSTSLRQPHPSQLLAPSQTPSAGRSQSAPPKTSIPFTCPQRLKSVDITRCHQISKEMIQWLRTYVAEVKCDASRGPWGDSSAFL